MVPKPGARWCPRPGAQVLVATPESLSASVAWGARLAAWCPLVPMVAQPWCPSFGYLLCGD